MNNVENFFVSSSVDEGWGPQR